MKDEDRDILPEMSNDIKWLKMYFDAEIKAVRQAVEKVENTNKEAVDKVEKTNYDYRQTQNEWRGQIKDQSVQFVTRVELEAVKSQTATFVTRREVTGTMIAVLTLLVALIGILVAYIMKN